MSDDQIGQDEIEKLLSQAQDADSGGGSAEVPPAASAGNEGNDVALDQSEIEALMSGGAPGAAPAATVASAPPSVPPTASADPPGSLSQSDVDLLLGHAEAALASIDNEQELPDGVKPFQFADLSGTPASTEAATLELMGDVQLDLNIELGRTHMHLEDVLRMRRGSVVPLDKLAGDPVDVFVNGRKIARGEVLVLNDNFCVRVTELVIGDAAVA